MGGFRGQKLKNGGNLPNGCVCVRVRVCVCVCPSKHYTRRVCGPFGTKFGTHMQIHLEKVVAK